MKGIKKTLCLLLSLVMILSMGVPAFAFDNATSEAQANTTSSETSPFSIELSTDKSSYSATGIAKITAKVTNTSGKDIKNVSAEAVFGELAPCKKKSSQTTAEAETLKDGESFEFTYSATINKNVKKLNIIEKIILFFVRLFNGGYSAKDNGFDNGREFVENSNDIKFGKRWAKNTVKVWFGESGDNSIVTRSEWILTLADTLNWSKKIQSMNNTNCKFDDIAGKECEKVVQYASLIKIFDEITGSFYPDAPATREFAAVTAVRAMGFLNTQEIKCADKNSIKHPCEVYTAVNVGIMELSNNCFYPDKNLTKEELEKAVSKILEIEGTGQNTKEHSEIEYTNNYVELSDNVKYTQIDSEKFSIDISNETKALQAGQIIFLNEEYYKISSIEERNNKYIVTVTEPSMQEVFRSINMGGSRDLSASDFIPAEGVKIIQTQARTRSSIDITDMSLEFDHEIQKNVKLYGKVEIKNPKMDFNLDIDWSKISFTNLCPDVKDVHAILTFDSEISFGISDTRDEKAPLKDGAITLGSYPVFGMAGIGIYVEVAIAYTIEGKAEVVFSTSGKAGYQIYNNIPKQIVEFTQPHYDSTTLEATVKTGPKISGLLELTERWKLIDFYIFAGPALKGTAKIRDTGLFCLDATVYLFAKFEAMQESIIANWMDVKCSYDIFDEENSIFKDSIHFENMKRVPECTYSGEESVTNFAGGDGSEENPYQVATPAQLNAVRYHLDKHFIQIADIDLSGWGEWKPIGMAVPMYSTTGNSCKAKEELFTGTYNGNNYRIDNIKITDGEGAPEYDCYGLFAGTKDATLKNINVTNLNIDISKSGTDYPYMWKEEGMIYSVCAGGIAGICKKSNNGITVIDNCLVTGKIHISPCADAYVGGITGYGGTFTRCKNYADIDVYADSLTRYEYPSSHGYCGGITGHPNSVNGKIDMCTNYGNIFVAAGVFLYSGGISGIYGQISNSLNFGRIGGNLLHYGHSSTSFENCNVGGIVGATSSDFIKNCINYGEIYGIDVSTNNSKYSGSGYGVSVGGICGDLAYYNGRLISCYNLGKYITANQEHAVVGRIAGHCSNRSDCYSWEETFVNNSITTASSPTSDVPSNNVNGGNLTKEEMLKEETYKGFDFDNIWKIDLSVGGAVLK